MVHLGLSSWNGMEERVFHTQQFPLQSMYWWDPWAEGELTCPKAAVFISQEGVDQGHMDRVSVRDGDTHWSFPGEIIPLMALMTALTTPGKPSVKSRHAVTVVIPSLHHNRRNAGAEATASGPTVRQGSGALRSFQELSVLSPRWPWGPQCPPSRRRSWGSRVPADTQLCTGKGRTGHWASQPCWEDKHLSRNIYFVHKITAVLNYREKTTYRDSWGYLNCFRWKNSQESKGKYKCFGNPDKH